MCEMNPTESGDDCCGEVAEESLEGVLVGTHVRTDVRLVQHSGKLHDDHEVWMRVG